MVAAIGNLTNAVSNPAPTAITGDKKADLLLWLATNDNDPGCKQQTIAKMREIAGLEKLPSS